MRLGIPAMQAVSGVSLWSLRRWARLGTIRVHRVGSPKSRLHCTLETIEDLILYACSPPKHGKHKRHYVRRKLAAAVQRSRALLEAIDPKLLERLLGETKPRKRGARR